MLKLIILTGLINNSGLISLKAKVDCLPPFFPGEDAIFSSPLRRVGASAQFPSIVGNACLFFTFSLLS